MASDMFYNYDNNITYKQGYAPEDTKLNYNTESTVLTGTNGVYISRNIKNQPTGIIASKNSSFTLRFAVSTDIINATNIVDLYTKAVFSIKIFDRLDEIYFTKSNLPISSDDGENVVEVAIISSDEAPEDDCYEKALTSGRYKVELTMVLNGITYTLFSERDGMLCIL